MIELVKKTSCLIYCAILFPILTLGQIDFREGQYDRTSISLIDGFLIVVRIKVNGVDKQFYVDTGATTSAISKEFATELKLSPLGITSLITATGTDSVPWGCVNVRIGHKKIETVPVLITDLRAVKAHSKEIAGIIGNNILENFNYLIDYKNRQFIMERNDEIGSKLAGETLFFPKLDGRMVLAVKSPVGNTYKLVLDSGAMTPVLFVDAKSLKSVGTIQSVSGTASYESSTFDWKFGNSLTLSVRGIKVGKTPDRVEDGLVATNLFDLIYINNQYKMVMLNPTPFDGKARVK